MGTEKPCRAVRVKCPNRGGRACTVHQVTQLHNDSPLVAFLEFSDFSVGFVLYDFNNGMNFI